jgi:hypothetical protein
MISSISIKPASSSSCLLISMVSPNMGGARL